MKTGFLNIKNKILLSVICSVVICAVIISIFLIQRNDEYIEESYIEEVEADLEGFEMVLEQENDILETVFQTLHNNNELIESFEEDEEGQIITISEELAGDLEENFDITHLSLYTPGLEALHHVNEDEEILGEVESLRNTVIESDKVEQGFFVREEGLFLATTGPVHDNTGDLVGVLEIGKTIDSQDLDMISENLESDLTIFKEDKRVATTIREEDGQKGQQEPPLKKPMLLNMYSTQVRYGLAG